MACGDISNFILSSDGSSVYDTVNNTVHCTSRMIEFSKIQIYYINIYLQLLATLH